MKVGKSSLRIRPPLLVFIKVLDGRRVRVAVVKIAYLCRYIDGEFRSLTHGETIFRKVSGRRFSLPEFS
jgi:hypothetical protein